MIDAHSSLLTAIKGLKTGTTGELTAINPALERNLLQLLNHWRANQLPIVHVVHHS